MIYAFADVVDNAAVCSLSFPTHDTIIGTPAQRPGCTMP
jgi:hypothetical protein